MKVADLRREAEEKYTDLPLELEDGTVVHLQNLLRLNDQARRTAQVMLDSLDKKETADGQELDQLGHQERVIRDLLKLVADNPGAIKDAVDSWDLPMLLLVIERWTERTQVGEADSSAS
jgi:hypothetical protein